MRQVPLSLFLEAPPPVVLQLCALCAAALHSELPRRRTRTTLARQRAALVVLLNVPPWVLHSKRASFSLPCRPTARPQPTPSRLTFAPGTGARSRTRRPKRAASRSRLSWGWRRSPHFRGRMERLPITPCQVNNIYSFLKCPNVNLCLSERARSPLLWGFGSGVRARKRWNYKKVRAAERAGTGVDVINDHSSNWAHVDHYRSVPWADHVSQVKCGNHLIQQQVSSFWLNAFRRLWLFRFILKKFLCLSTTQVSWVFQLGMGKGVVLLNSCPSWIHVDILLLSSPGYFRKCPEARESLQCRVSVYERLLMCNRS